MANEIRISVSLTYDDGDDVASQQIVDFMATVVTRRFAKFKQKIGIVAEQLNTGDFPVPGWACIVNRDPTNSVSIRAAAEATDLIAIPPGGVALFHFGGVATSPFAIATTAECDIVTLIAAA